MAVDTSFRYLATGDGDGFVKVWRISEYIIDANDELPLTKKPRKPDIFKHDQWSEILKSHIALCANFGLVVPFVALQDVLQPDMYPTSSR